MPSWHSFSTQLDGPVLNVDRLRENLELLAPDIAKSLQEHGYFTIDDPTKLMHSDLGVSKEILNTLRSQAVALREEGRYEQSWSEAIDAAGTATRFDKPGVFACEPDGADYDTAPDLISYMATLITGLPPALNEHLDPDTACISNASFNAKLAVTEASSEYPLHVDNPKGVAGQDFRKLTCILYLNPDYEQESDKGELRLQLLNQKVVDLAPSLGRWLLFWTDEIPHKVLPTGPTAAERYALTIWLADEDPVSHIHNPRSKFADLRIHAFEN